MRQRSAPLEVVVIAAAALAALAAGTQVLEGGACAPAHGCEAASGRAGTIHGTITIRSDGQRRVANRYASAGAPAQKLQPIAAVVYLRGGGLAERAAPGSPQQMAQRDTTFQPNVVIVTAGGAVDFPNHDSFFHNVFSYSKTKRFDLGRYPNPESKRVDFPEAGVVNVFCEIHKSMRAVIMVVDDGRYAAVVADDGRYEIENVPPGTWELVIWHADRGEKTQRVQVPASGSVRVDAEL